MAGKTSAAIDGSLHPDFMDVALEFQRQLARTPGGGAVCVFQEGECVVDLWGGARDEVGRPWQQDTMAPSFSTTKGVASTLLHILRDRGLFEYDDTVARHWPEFGRNGKQGITIRHVLAHQSGLYHIRRMIDHADRMLDWEHMTRAIEEARPVHPPGTRTGYHGLTFGFLVGEIAQRVTGRPFPELVQEEVARPLGLDGLYIGAPREELHRAACLIWPRLGILGPPSGFDTRLEDAARFGAGALRRALRPLGLDLDLASMLDALAPRGISSFDFGAHETLRASIPAASGLFTARSLARMYAVLAAGGELDGAKLFTPDTFARATQVQARAAGRKVLPFDMRWRLGYHGVATTRGIPRSAFGHFGFGGSGAWADPRRELAVGLIVNSGIGTPFGDLRIVRIGGAVLRCAHERRRRFMELRPPPSAGARTRAPDPRRTRADPGETPSLH